LKFVLYNFSYIYNTFILNFNYIAFFFFFFLLKKKKDDGSAISIFIFDIERNYDKVDLARNAFKRARTIRHPALLTFIDGVEVFITNVKIDNFKKKYFYT